MPKPLQAVPPRPARRGEYVRYGCRAPGCGYSTIPSDSGTPYDRCPRCRGPWGPFVRVQVTEVFPSGSATAQLVNDFPECFFD